ncbi:MAG: hypothetical protein WC291_02945 [Thermodesulfovibrionales bacterium]|jgi:hypothetical protein
MKVAAKYAGIAGLLLAAENSMITHFYYPVGPKGWKNIKYFLPFYRLMWAEKVSRRMCQTCSLAARVHPMVQTGDHVYSKLCTVSVIKNGLLLLDEVFEDTGGCGAKDDDYVQAQKMFGSATME